MFKNIFNKFFKRKATNSSVKKYPHELHPELLLWEKGDALEYISGSDVIGNRCMQFSMLPYFIKFDENDIYLSHSWRSDFKIGIPIAEVLKHYRNKSLVARQVNQRIETITDYEAFVQHLKISIDYLRQEELHAPNGEQAAPSAS